MRFVLPILPVVVILMTASTAYEGLADRTLVEWRFDKAASAATAAGALLGWQPNKMVADVGPVKGALHMKGVDWDPLLVSPRFEIKTGPWQYIEVKMSATLPGRAEFFWTNTTHTQYGGFSPGKETYFEVSGDGQYHTYRISPAWQAEGKIILLRFDVYDGAEFNVKSIRVAELARPKSAAKSFTFDRDAEGWQAYEGVANLSAADGALVVKTKAGDAELVSPRLAFEASKCRFLVVRMSADRGTVCSARIVTGNERTPPQATLPLKADGRMHNYNFPVALPWDAGPTIEGIALTPSNEAGATVRIDSVAFAAAPVGPPDLTLMSLAPDLPVTRVGQVIPVSVRLRNDGGSAAHDIRAELTAPAGVEVLGAAEGVPDQLDPFEEVTISWKVRGDRAEAAHLTATATCPGAEGPAARQVADVPFTPSLGLPKASYVPEPHPVHSDYHIGIYYFPGWHYGTHIGWDAIKPYPERMPMLGWYNEGNPEVADWEIKWAVEHGVEFFIFDWYRKTKGGPVQENLGDALDDGFLHARYRNLMKFAIMWENANGAGVADRRDLMDNLLPFWIKHYFSQPDYMRVDGKPLLVVYYPQGVERDLGKPEQVKEAFDDMRAACRAAGLGGLYILGCVGDQPSTIRRMETEGYDATSAYNYVVPGPSKPATGMTAYDYSDILKVHEKIWRDKRAVGALPDVPLITAGWDPRPWHGAKTLFYWTDNTPAELKKACLDAKALIDASTGGDISRKYVFLEAWNEWGEGAYISPSRGMGFGYLDAIRSVFAKAQAAPRDITPWDVGLGPYAAKPLPPRTAWEFSTDGDLEGWNPNGGLAASTVEGGVLKSRSITDDPAYMGPALSIVARKYPVILVRMKADRDTIGQVYWRTSLFPISEESSVIFKVKGDGRFHEYRLEVSKNPSWWGEIDELRFDPVAARGINFEVDYIRLSAAPEAGTGEK